MKYTLNESYNGDVLVTQCGKIFKKELATEIDIDNVSTELEAYIAQKFLVPFSQQVIDAKNEIKKQESVIKDARKDVQIEKPAGLSTSESKEESFKPKANTDIKLEESKNISKD